MGVLAFSLFLHDLLFPSLITCFSLFWHATELNNGMVSSKGHLNNNFLLEFSRSDEGT